jgi:DNA polymerase-4
MKILHVDMNSFFASCEVAANPELENKPVIVAGIDVNRGVVTTASYQARKYGIKAGMPTRDAFKLCPNVIAISPNFSLYKKFSMQIMNIFKQYTLLVEQASIDEAYLDISRINVDPKIIAKQIQQQIMKELKLGCSIGIATNKYFAKLASDIQKPNGITQVTDNNYQTIIWNLKIEDAKFIGKKTIPLLKKYNINTIGDFAKLNQQQLAFVAQKRKTLKVIHGYVNNNDNRKVEIHSQDERKSVGFSSTFSVDTTDINLLKNKLKIFSFDIQKILDNLEMEAYTVTLTLRYTGFITKTHSSSSSEAITLQSEIYALGINMLDQYWNKKSLRLIGIQLSSLRKSEYKQIKIIND